MTRWKSFFEDGVHAVADVALRMPWLLGTNLHKLERVKSMSISRYRHGFFFVVVKALLNYST
jgi:hypothetical protein